MKGGREEVEEKKNDYNKSIKSRQQNNDGDGKGSDGGNDGDAISRECERRRRRVGRS